MLKALSPFIFRVCYSDTDAAGFIHHARYLEIFERSRSAWLHHMNMGPVQLLNEHGILLPIREITINFHKPGRLDDLLLVDQHIHNRSRTQFTVHQTASKVNEKNSNLAPLLIASAVFHIVCVDKVTLKPKRLPDWLFPDN
jgi:acyl-CoA thioester hydrolase